MSNPVDPRKRNPKKEAQDYIDANLDESLGLTAYVLESSPPAHNADPLWADIPTQITADTTTDIAKSITPTSAGSHSYNDFSELADFASERWLGHWKNLPPLPGDWLTKLVDAHRLAFSVISEARNQNNQKIGLRWVMGGFGTPFYGDDTQVRVADGMLILQKAEEVTAAPITTLKEAGDFLGLEPSSTQREGDSPELGDINQELIWDSQTNDFLGDWFGFASSVLEELLLKGQDGAPFQIWPGHFDAAVELNNGDKRGTFGASPGDANHPEPYFYVLPHAEPDATNPFWNAKAYTGAEMTLSQIKDSKHERTQALNFCETGLGLL